MTKVITIIDLDRTLATSNGLSIKYRELHFLNGILIKINPLP